MADGLWFSGARADGEEAVCGEVADVEEVRDCEGRGCLC